jgi:hypothetical protein
MIITFIIALGLVLLTIFVGFRYSWKASLAVLIPLLYVGYWTLSIQVPKYFGYALPLNFAELNNQARFISGFEGKDAIYILLLEKGDTQPRLISIPNTAKNKQTFYDLQKQSKAGKSAVLRKSKKTGATDREGQGPDSESDIEGVELKDQDIIQKGADQ